MSTRNFNTGISALLLSVFFLGCGAQKGHKKPQIQEWSAKKNLQYVLMCLVLASATRHKNTEISVLKGARNHTHQIKTNLADALTRPERA